MKLINWGANVPSILHKLESMGYKKFDNGDFDLNLIGLRDPERTPGSFDDQFCVCYKENNEWIEERYNCTTDPSMEQHLQPTNKKGVAVLKPGRYSGVYKLDLHNGKYEALCQRNGKVIVYRDDNLNAQTDYINEESGYLSLIHI